MLSLGLKSHTVHCRRGWCHVMCFSRTGSTFFHFSRKKSNPLFPVAGGAVGYMPISSWTLSPLPVTAVHKAADLCLCWQRQFSIPDYRPRQGDSWADSFLVPTVGRSDWIPGLQERWETPLDFQDCWWESLLVPRQRFLTYGS